jgi:hypothetical protein
MLRYQLRYPVLATWLDLNGMIIGGPFRGIRYPHSGTIFYFELLGTYEQCLIAVITDVIRRQPPLIVDVGAAYGYYALGFAARCPRTQVIAYEMDPTRAQVIRRYSRINGLQERLTVFGKCEIANLRNSLSAPGAFLLMDAEGYEALLLDPEQVPTLADTEILAELHENFVPGITDRVSRLFANTHALSLIKHGPVRKDEMDVPPWIDRLITRYWPSLTFEERDHSICWMHMVPQNGAPG